ncbi:MAG: manganese catalase family protein [Clostridia bacterium]|nr:manganese catalase family protein [Clostridia bacterium]
MNSRIRTVCECASPYPELRVERQNAHYARLLSLAYAGQESELTTILSYIYGSKVCEGRAPDTLADTLRCISKVEMRHLDMLGELITLLGGDPRFCGPDARVGINTAMLAYRKEPAQVIRGAIAGEEGAIRLYGDLIRNINDECVRAVLRRIVMDEELHLKIFREMAGTSVYNGR